MKRIAIALLLVFIAIGCTGTTTKESSTTTPFIGGTNGLILSFAQGAPPETVYDGGDFPFGIDVILKNEGEYSVPPQRSFVKISGILSKDFGDIPLEKTVTENLEKTSKDPEGNIIRGTESHIEFNDLRYIGTLEGNSQFTIRSDVCYEYGTSSTTMLCVRDDLLDTTSNGVCKVTETKSVFNSGAPVQVITLEESATGRNTVTLSFTIAKKGNGDVFKPKFHGNGGDVPSKQCQEERRFRDIVWVEVDAANNEINNNMKCQGLSSSQGSSGRTGYTTLYNGERIIRCSVDLSAAGIRGNYEKIINIKLFYDYQEYITTSLLVKHATE